MKKIVAMMLAVFMLTALLPQAALAADLPRSGSGTAAVVMNTDGKAKPSMCDPLFAGTADIRISGDTAAVSLYVAYPVPSFPEEGKDGTIKEMKVRYDGVEYPTVSDLETKPMMTPKASSPIFGLKAGEPVQAQILTVELPVQALQAGHLDVSAFVNVVMKATVEFDMVLSELNFPAVLEDGHYYVDIALWHATADKPSMGDKAFENHRKVLLTVEDGTVTNVQVGASPVNMAGFVSAVTEVQVDGKPVEVLKTGKVTTQPAGNEIEYIRLFQFAMPEAGQPADLEGVTYAPIAFRVADTPMGDSLISARARFDWTTVTATDDTELEVPELPVEPTDPDPTDPDPTDPVEPTDPEPTDPVEPTDPEPTDPVEPTDPEPTDPVEPTDPEPTDPAEPTDPEPTDPAEPTDPEPTDPAEPTDPKPTEPAPTEPEQKPDVPQTGDQTPVVMLLALLAASAAGLLLLSRKRRAV